MDLEALKKNQKTSYLADMYIQLEKNEAELLAMVKDPSMKELAEGELSDIKLQKVSLMTQMRQITESEKEEEEFPNEAILEVRAGAGGDEASLFAAELAAMYQGYAIQMGWTF